jgi:hypothetical protein
MLMNLTFSPKETSSFDYDFFGGPGAWIFSRFDCITGSGFFDSSPRQRSPRNWRNHKSIYKSYIYIYMCVYVCMYACALYIINPRNPKVLKVLHVLQWPSFCEVPLQQLLGNSWDLSVASDGLCETRPSAWIAAGFAAFHLQASAWILGKSSMTVVDSIFRGYRSMHL